MKTFITYLSLFIGVWWLILPIIPQDKIISKKKPSRSEHITGTINSDRFTVENLSFFRKYDYRDRKEVLEVMFDIKNKTLDTLDLKLFLLGFHQKDGINSKYRKLVPYPSWRKRDLDKYNFKIVFLDSIPKINPNDVARIGALDSLSEETMGSKYASFLSYIRHIEKNSDSGIPFKLYSFEDTPITKAKQESFYKITELRASTNIVGIFHMKYRLNRQFDSINHVGILISDTQKKTITHRQFYKLKKSKIF